MWRLSVRTATRQHPNDAGAARGVVHFQNDPPSPDPKTPFAFTARKFGKVGVADLSGQVIQGSTNGPAIIG